MTSERKINLSGKVVTFDIDGVIADSATLAVEKFYNYFFFVPRRTVCGIVTYSEMYKWVESIIKNDHFSKLLARHIWNSGSVLKNALPIGGAKTMVYGLLKQGADVHFVTSRPAAVGASTHEWVKKRFKLIPAKNVHIGDGNGLQSDFKAATCEKLCSKLHFEDSYEHALLIAERGINTAIVAQPWNHSCRESNTNERIHFPESSSSPKLWWSYKAWRDNLRGV